MKDEILLIIHNHYPTSPTIIDNAVANELQRLMCYREVRAYFKAYDELYYNLLLGEFRQEAMSIFLNDYPEAMILEAIEKVKNEQS